MEIFFKFTIFELLTVSRRNQENVSSVLGFSSCLNCYFLQIFWFYEIHLLIFSTAMIIYKVKIFTVCIYFLAIILFYDYYLI